MTQQGPMLRRYVVRVTLATAALLAMLAPTASAAVPVPVSPHGRTARLRREEQPTVAAATHGRSATKATAGDTRSRRSASATRGSARPARGSAGIDRRAAVAVPVQPAVSKRAALAKNVKMSPAARRRQGQNLRREAAQHREPAQHRSPQKGSQEIAVHGPAGVPAGGELSVDDFMRAADAAATVGTAATVDAAPAHSTPRPRRIDGFGAEGAVLPADRPTRADTPPLDSATAQAAAHDPRFAALVHPSHEELAEEAATPVFLPGLYRNGRLIVPAPLKGSHEILVHQNLMANDEGLQRVYDDDDLRRLRTQRLLVDFPESASLHVNPELNYDRRCARIWTVKFAADTARAFYARFHEPLQVNSAVRTVAYQRHLLRTNGNAAPIAGETASPHLTGQAIDFAKRGMTTEQLAWMRAYLKPIMDAGKVDVEEEFQQACFHISVYESYLPAKHLQVAQAQVTSGRD